MKLANPFPDEVRVLFIDVYWCFKCGRSDRGLELHHIWGRISGSALNACPLCTHCHAEILHTPEVHRELFRLTISFLTEIKYKLKAVDEVFLTLVKNDLAGLFSVL